MPRYSSPTRSLAWLDGIERRKDGAAPPIAKSLASLGAASAGPFALAAALVLGGARGLCGVGKGKLARGSGHATTVRPSRVSSEWAR